MKFYPSEQRVHFKRTLYFIGFIVEKVVPKYVYVAWYITLNITKNVLDQRLKTNKPNKPRLVFPKRPDAFKVGYCRISTR